uniref:Fish-egg lectin-like n=1 Tax=Astyanax mexicanus TaxID=7994 RepID=A0A3B1ILN9_ASTMX
MRDFPFDPCYIHGKCHIPTCVWSETGRHCRLSPPLSSFPSLSFQSVGARAECLSALLPPPSRSLSLSNEQVSECVCAREWREVFTYFLFCCSAPGLYNLLGWRATAAPITVCWNSKLLQCQFSQYLATLLEKVDAGGKLFAAGLNMGGVVFCLGEEATTGFAGPGSPASWTQLPARLKYYSCGPYSCWGVNTADEIFILKPITGSLSMIEVSTDGRVYGVNSVGDIYQRYLEGILPCNPAGTGWRHVSYSEKVKHVSYDLGHLWLIGKDNHIMDCTE